MIFFKTIVLLFDVIQHFYHFLQLILPQVNIAISQQSIISLYMLFFQYTSSDSHEPDSPYYPPGKSTVSLLPKDGQVKKQDQHYQ